MGFYMNSAEGVIFTIITLLLQIIRIAIPIIAIVFLVKGIKYLNKKNAEKNKD